MNKTVQFLEELGSKTDNVAVFQFFRANILGRLTLQNVPQLDVGCPTSPGDKTTGLFIFFVHLTSSSLCQLHIPICPLP